MMTIRRVNERGHARAQVAEDEVTLNGRTLLAGEGSTFSEATTLTRAAKDTAQTLLFDLNRTRI